MLNNENRCKDFFDSEYPSKNVQIFENNCFFKINVLNILYIQIMYGITRIRYLDYEMLLGRQTTKHALNHFCIYC